MVLQSLKSARDEGGHGEVARDAGMLAPRDEVGLEEEQSASHHTPTDSPPKESVFEERERDGDVEEEGSSDWNPYAEAATPHLAAHKQSLQPTVEEYYSEFTPARAISTQAPRPLDHDDTIAETEASSPAKSDDPSTPGRPSSETISPTRSPVLHRSAPRQFSSQTDEASWEQQLDDLRAKCQQLEHLNAALNQAVDEERRMRREESAAHEARLADAARRERDLAEMKDRAFLHKDDFRREFSEMKANLQGQEVQLEASRKEMERLKCEHAAEAQKMQRERVEHERDVRALEQDCELARRSRDDAEETARAVREELDALRDDPGAALERMRVGLGDQDGDLDGRIVELEEQVRRVEMDNEKLKEGKAAAKEETSKLRGEFSALRQRQEGETVRLTADHRRAVAVAEELQTQLQELRQELHDERTAHEAETQRLKQDSHPAPADDDLQTQLNDAILDRDAAHDSLQTLHTDLDATRSELADLRAVNAALDARVSDAVRRRESYWRGRLEEVEAERKVMAKALMQMWGREELGIAEEEGGGQGYEYLFVKREGMGRLGA